MSLGNGQQHYPGSSLGLQRLGLRASAFLGYTRCTLALQAATATVPLTADTGERDKSSIQAQSGNLLWDKGGTGWQGWKWGRRRCSSCLEECLGITHTHTHTHTHAQTHTYMHTHTHAHTHIHMLLMRLLFSLLLLLLVYLLLLLLLLIIVLFSLLLLLLLLIIVFAVQRLLHDSDVGREAVDQLDIIITITITIIITIIIIIIIIIIISILNSNSNNNNNS